MSADLSLILRHRPRCLTSPESESYVESIVAEIIKVCLPLGDLLSRIHTPESIERICLEYPTSLILGLKHPGIMNAVRLELDRQQRVLDERFRTAQSASISRIIDHDRSMIERSRAFIESTGWDLISAYKHWVDTGLVEPVMSPFSDVSLMAHLADPGVIQAQLLHAIDVYQTTFGHVAPGFLLTGNGHTSSMAGVITDTEVKYLIVDQAAFTGALSPLPNGPYAPVHCPDSALAIFADQRNFYRWKSSATPEAHYRRRDVLNSGSWGHTGRGHEVLVYNPDEGASAAQTHGKLVCDSRIQEARTVIRRAQGRPILLGSVDMGRRAHDWYEVTDFVEGFLQRLTETNTLMWSTPEQYLAANPRNSTCWLGPTMAHEPLSELLLSRIPTLHEAACRLHTVHQLSGLLDAAHQRDLESATRHLLWAQQFAGNVELSKTASSYARHVQKLSRFLRTLEQALPDDAEVPRLRPMPKPRAPRHQPVHNPLIIT